MYRCGHAYVECLLFPTIGQNMIGISHLTLYLQSFLWINHVVDYLETNGEFQEGNNKLGELNPFLLVLFSQEKYFRV